MEANIKLSKYQLVIKVPFDAIDDIQARLKARQMIKLVNFDDVEIKLQEIIENKAPRGVVL